ncbi:MAG: hypothetical protein HXX09_03910 [Bacteroidetes bacterium]|nr:hypothetical protein [Bacteroidota bacterium]
MKNTLIFCLLIFSIYSYGQKGNSYFETSVESDSIKIHVLFEVVDNNCIVTFTIKNNKENNIFFDFEKPDFNTMKKLNGINGIFIDNGFLGSPNLKNHLTCLKTGKELSFQFKRIIEPIEKEKFDFSFEFYYLDDSFFKINREYSYNVNSTTEINNNLLMYNCKVIRISNYEY